MERLVAEARQRVAWRKKIKEAEEAAVQNRDITGLVNVLQMEFDVRLADGKTDFTFFFSWMGEGNCTFEQGWCPIRLPEKFEDSMNQALEEVDKNNLFKTTIDFKECSIRFVFRQ